MNATCPAEPIQSLHITHELVIDAPIEVVYESVLAELGPESQFDENKPMPMKLEAWPGGRWFRDLGDSKGHLWGHVQAIKPPALIELCGPMFMSFAATSNIQYRLSTEGTKTRLKFSHRAMGQIPADMMQGMTEGWTFHFKRVVEIAAARTTKSRK